MRTTRKILSMILAFVLVLGLLPTAVSAAGYVYISVSFDGQYISNQNGGYIAYVPVSMEDVAAVDLNEYGLGDYLYDEDGDGTYETTALQMVIYAHENFYGGSWSDVTFTGSPGSTYFAGGIFGFTENLNYYLNGEYPMDEALTEANGYGTGATSDRIVLEAGDYLDIGSFSDWSFYSDSNYGFHFFADTNGNFTHYYSAETGSELPVKLVRSFSSMGSGATVYDEPSYDISYGTSLYNAAGTVTTDDAGCANITFNTAGTYYLWCNGGYGAEYPEAIVSTPAYAKVTVTGEDVVVPDDGEDTPEETFDGKTALKITASEGITLQAVMAKCCSCYSMVYVKSMQTAVDTNLEWTCSRHGTTLDTPYYNISVTATYTSEKPIEKVTINEETYSVNSTDDVTETINITETSYIQEATNAIQIVIAEESEPDDLVIHIHAEEVVEEEPPRVAQDVSAVLNATMAQLAATVTEPVFGTTAGEWTVLSLARGGYYAKDNAYFTDYYERIVETVNETAATVNLNGALHKNKSTDNSRLIVALSSIGKNATSVGDWDLVEAYSVNGLSWIKNQGINGTIWALIALDSNNYATTDTTLRQQCVDSILSLQHDDGGWSLQANLTYASDPDVTGMVLQALYPYRSQSAVATACEEAFACLSAMQQESGAFVSGGSENAESTAQVIVACATWGINPDTDSRFIKGDNSAVDALLAHYVEGEAMFQHIIGAGSNAMATDQSCYALVAYDRLMDGKTALYDYSDVTFDPVTPDTGDDDTSGDDSGSGSGNTGDGSTDTGDGSTDTGDGSTDTGDDTETKEMSATLGVPAEIEGTAGTTFNAIISINEWDNDAGYKLIDFIMTVPEGLSVTGVTAGSRLAGGEVSWNLEAETGKLRVAYFDANKNNTLEISGTEFPSEVFTIGLKLDQGLTSGTKLDFAITGMSVKLTSDSEDKASMVIVNTTNSDGTSVGGSSGVVTGVSFSAVCLYEGDDIDLIPATKKAVAVAVTGISKGAKLAYNDGTNKITFLYSAEITAKTGVSTYVALVDTSIRMENFVNEDYFAISSAAAETITFADINGDGVINAQDALAAVDAWLRKGDEPTGDAILLLNVNGDSRINTFDALGIVEKFVNGSDYGVVTKAATITGNS